VPALNEAACQVSENEIAQLVAQVYETAPPAVRVSLLQQLLKPLGVLSLIAVADGLFAKILFGSGWPHMQIRFEDAQKVKAEDVVALVERVQQVSVNAVDGLSDMLTSSPMVAGSAAAALLITVLMQRARTRREGDKDAEQWAAL
jgi:N-acyl-L-homoserine lactone synthetase